MLLSTKLRSSLIILIFIKIFLFKIFVLKHEKDNTNMLVEKMKNSRGKHNQNSEMSGM
jgi:hypothetical protein